MGQCYSYVWCGKIDLECERTEEGIWGLSNLLAVHTSNSQVTICLVNIPQCIMILLVWLKLYTIEVTYIVIDFLPLHAQ